MIPTVDLLTFLFRNWSESFSGPNLVIGFVTSLYNIIYSANPISSSTVVHFLNKPARLWMFCAHLNGHIYCYFFCFNIPAAWNRWNMGFDSICFFGRRLIKRVSIVLSYILCYYVSYKLFFFHIKFSCNCNYSCGLLFKSSTGTYWPTLCYV